MYYKLMVLLKLLSRLEVVNERTYRMVTLLHLRDCIDGVMDDSGR